MIWRGQKKAIGQDQRQPIDEDEGGLDRGQVGEEQ